MPICKTPLSGGLSWRFGQRVLVISLTALVMPVPAVGQELEGGVKRAFLDRYLDCAESATDALRLVCYDDLLVDIPEWLEAVDEIDSVASNDPDQTVLDNGTPPVDAQRSCDSNKGEISNED